MNEVIYLEPDEEITSVIDKLKTLNGVHSVHLVVPKRASILQSVVNLKILKKEAESLKLELSLVTSDRIGRNLASQVGLTVYDSIDSPRPIIEPARERPNLNDVIEIDLSEKKPIKPPPGVKVNYYQENKNQLQRSQLPDKENFQEGPKTHISASPMSAENYNPPVASKPKKPIKFWKKLIIPLIIIITGLILIYIYYPKATIDLTVRAEPIEEQIEITVNSNINKISEDNKNVPGEILTIENKTEKEFSATGKKDVGEKAHGEVTISNGGGTNQDLSTGAKLETSSGLVFTTTSNVTVSAATASVNPDGSISKKSGTSNINVEASEPGEKYNIGSSDFTVINKPTLSARNSSSFSGGLTKEITIVSQENIDESRKNLAAELQQSNQANLVEQGNRKNLNFIEEATVSECSNFYSNKKTGEEVEKFSTSLTCNSKIMAFSEDNYRAAVVSVLGNKIPSDKELVLSTDDAIEQGQFSTDFAAGTMKIEGRVKTKLAPKIDYDVLKRSLVGQGEITAENMLRENPAFSTSKINIQPSWWPKKLPRRMQSIIINKQYSY